MKIITHILVASLAILISFTARAECGNDLSIQSIPALTPDLTAPMIQHVETFEIAIPASSFNEKLAQAPLAKLLPGTAKISAVAATRNLTPAGFGTPGAPRVVCLADGSTALEEATDNQPGKVFSYKVWNYTTEVAKPIEYGLGSFQLEEIDAGHTRVTWTYSFKLRGDRFPGSLGGLGRWLFKTTFMERDYADMMAVSAKAMSTYFQ